MTPSAPTPPHHDPASVKSGTQSGKRTKNRLKTKEQKRASQFLDLHGIVHYLLTYQRVPVFFEGKLAYVKCPGVSKASFKAGIDKQVIENLAHYISHEKRS